ncbi:hypothetical protein CALVIDRAFT_530566 [Calocera viscosa TUFC12733]|uniref:Uncharacterized protein n=1 Tax=Calocera viscosa (strain TUFC12733) TaxID=1330018 RepID=A0A167HKZ7_CALVF|nr:hypothetical protein CALVIDRAFT_530566 [Calocera viscosa TUFC12733]
MQTQLQRRLASKTDRRKAQIALAREQRKAQSSSRLATAPTPLPPLTNVLPEPRPRVEEGEPKGLHEWASANTWNTDTPASGEERESPHDLSIEVPDDTPVDPMDEDPSTLRRSSRAGRGERRRPQLYQDEPPMGMGDAIRAILGTRPARKRVGDVPLPAFHAEDLATPDVPSPAEAADQADSSPEPQPHEEVYTTLPTAFGLYREYSAHPTQIPDAYTLATMHT